MKLWDDPYIIVEKSIEAQRRILTGYKAHPRVSREKFEEAWNPRHAAISLAGEPTLYPQLGDLIKAYHRKDMTTFLVTNGTMPHVLKELDEEPTQLYVSLCAPNEKVHKELCRPQIPNAWGRLNETLELLSSFKCPTVIRITLVKNYNMCDFEGYAQLIRKSNPTYVEPKAYSYLGYSRLRLSFRNVPTHTEVREFGERLGDLIGYNIIDESLPSRVVLLSIRERPIKIA
jgi:tRNA wybutosine-synthesizing protein 1